MSRLMQFRCPCCQKIIKVEKRLEPIGKRLCCQGCQKEFILAKENLLDDAPEKDIEIRLVQFCCPCCQKIIKVEKKLEPIGKRLCCQGCQKEFILAKENLLDNTPEEDIDSYKRQRKFGHYKIIEEIGKGAIGQVYKVYDTKLKQTMALKCLLSGAHAEKTQEERFLREAETMAKLEHPNIVKVYDIGYVNRQYYFTMEMVAGINFDQFRKQNQRKQSLVIFIKACKAIAYAHSQKVVHRDLKPTNIMVAKNNEPKVMDFGLVKLAEASNQLTASGMILGTIQYMSPEQAKGNSQNAGPQSDQYALGIILYEILTGTVPFANKTIAKLVVDIVKENPQPPNQINPDLAKDLSDVCLKAIAKQQENRYQTMNEFIEALEKMF